MINREPVKFAGTAGPVVLAAYPTFAFSDAIDCENFLQVAFELYPGTMVGDLFYTLQFCDDEIQPSNSASWLPDPIDGASTIVSNDNQIVVNRLVRRWSGSGATQVNTPLAHRWVRLGLAAGTSGSAMAIVKRVRLASQ